MLQKKGNTIIMIRNIQFFFNVAKYLPLLYLFLLFNHRSHSPPSLLPHLNMRCRPAYASAAVRVEAVKPVLVVVLVGGYDGLDGCDEALRPRSPGRCSHHGLFLWDGGKMELSRSWIIFLNFIFTYLYEKQVIHPNIVIFELAGVASPR